MYFGNRRPRGFHYTYRFNTDRGDVVRRLKNGESPEQIAADSEREYNNNGGGRHMSVNQPRSGCTVFQAILLLLVVALAAAIFIFG